MEEEARVLEHPTGSSSYGSFDREIARPLSRDVVGTDITFCDIEYSIPTKIKGTKVNKSILQKVSGYFKPGLNAILGPTGSGKTTLLDVVAGRKDRRYLSGIVLVNGERQPNNFKLISGYVIQEDVVLGTLTVRENLLFSASLRLPKNFTDKDRKERVNMIIDDLGLGAVADSKVGTELIRGVSGGERKRACIGMELITSPDVLFLDEPTTGLDASTACDVMDLLFNQARKGRNIICSIHQPRYSIFKLFDTLTLLSEGRLVYHGRNDQALSYFSQLGYECEQHNNPPDFFLDVINNESKARRMTFQNYHNENEDRIFSVKDKADGLSLADYYEQTNLSRDHREYIKMQVDHFQISEKELTFSTRRHISYQTSFFKQFALVFQRAARSGIRNPQTSIFQLLINVILGLAVGGIYYNIGRGESGLQNRVGVFFFVATNAFFGSMSALELFLKERRIFIHESANGYYRVSSYFFAKTLVDIIPLRLIPSIVFSAVTYWMIGLRRDVFKFLIYTGGLGMVALSGAGLAFLISSCVSVFAVANLLMVLPAIIMLLFSGLLINLKTLTEYIRWLKYLSVVRYALNILNVNELHGLTFNCGLKPGTNMSKPCLSGDEYLFNQGIELNELWTGFVAIGSITVILLTCTYIQLRRIKKET